MRTWVHDGVGRPIINERHVFDPKVYTQYVIEWHLGDGSGKTEEANVLISYKPTTSTWRQAASELFGTTGAYVVYGLRGRRSRQIAKGTL